VTFAEAEKRVRVELTERDRAQAAAELAQQHGGALRTPHRATQGGTRCLGRVVVAVSIKHYVKEILDARTVRAGLRF